MPRKMSDIEKRLHQFEEGIQAQANAKPQDTELARVKALFGGDTSGRNDGPRPPEVKISPEMKAAVYRNVIDIVKAGSSPAEIAQSVLAFIEDTVTDINTESGIINDTRGQGSGPVIRTSKGPGGGVFRRAE